MECTSIGRPLRNNQLLDVEALRERVDHCKWCEKEVKHIDKNSLPHTIEGKDYLVSDFVLHTRPCSSAYWAERRVDEFVIEERKKREDGKTRSGC